jgi:hypothetical protein
MTIPSWTESIAAQTPETAWDRVLLGDELLPGVAKVKVHLGHQIDIKKPRGSKWARLVDAGAPPARVEITLTLLPTQIEAFQNAMEVLRPLEEKRPQEPVDIIHPSTQLAGVTQVMVGAIDIPPPESGGTLTVTIECFEYREPVKTNKAKKTPTPKDGSEDWNVQPLIDALNPGAGGAQQNFSDPDQIESLP